MAFEDDLTGLLELEFVNGTRLTVNIAGVMRNIQAIPLYLIGVNEVKYNWQNVISVRKVTD